MRNALLYSIGFHGAVLFMALVALPGPDELPLLPSQVLPVELVTIDEYTNLKQAPKRVDPKPEIKPEPKPEVEPKPEAEVKPPPPPKVEPKPAPPAPEPEPELAPEPDKPAPVIEKVEAKPKPKPKPAPPKAVEKKKPETKFDPTRIAALLDKLPQDQAPPEAAPSRDEPEEEVAAASNFDSRLTLSEVDAFKVQMRRCWSVPAGAANAEDLVVQIKVYLNPDGSLAQPPKLINQARLLAGDVYFRTAAESAMRAIRRCAPFKMPAEKYSGWQELDLNFDPREMLGG